MIGSNEYDILSGPCICPCIKSSV